jgi:hypothetical protein
VSETMTVETGPPHVNVRLLEAFETHETFHRAILMMVERDANLETDRCLPAPTSLTINHLALHNSVADLEEAELAAISRIEAAVGISCGEIVRSDLRQDGPRETVLETVEMREDLRGAKRIEGLQIGWTVIETGRATDSAEISLRQG